MRAASVVAFAVAVLSATTARAEKWNSWSGRSYTLKSSLVPCIYATDFGTEGLEEPQVEAAPVAEVAGWGPEYFGGYWTPRYWRHTWHTDAERPRVRPVSARHHGPMPLLSRPVVHR
jgi:hypothetical protein